jgi:hypothetical protein
VLLLVLLLLGVLVAAIACFAGSISIARRDPRLSLVLSGVLFAVSYWTGGYSYRQLNAHGDGFAVLGAFVGGSGVAIVTGLALVCALILLAGALRSPVSRFAPLVLLPTVALIIGIQLSQTPRGHVEESRAQMEPYLEYLRQHGSEIRYREDCARVPRDYQATCQANHGPAPLPDIYTADGKFDEAAIRARNREVGATWARVNHATRMSDCLKVWAEYYESEDVRAGCKDFIERR